MIDVEVLRNMLGVSEADDGILGKVADEARDLILAYTNRKEDEWIPIFDGIQSLVARKVFNQLGAEGLRSKAEGAVSAAFDSLEGDVLPALNMFRAVRAL